MNSDEMITPSRRRLNQFLQCPFRHGDRVQSISDPFRVGEVINLAVINERLHLKIRLCSGVDCGIEVFGLPADWVDAVPF